VLALAALGLSACGGTPAKSSSIARAAATPTSPSAARNAKARITALDGCLHKHGIKLGHAANGRLPKGLTAARYRAALRVCLPASRGRSSRAAPSALANPAYRAALEAFVACMRRNGVHLGPPNETGKGPILSSKGVDVNGAAFRRADQTCSPIITAATAAARTGKK
jgi:hypothetical protein